MRLIVNSISLTFGELLACAAALLNVGYSNNGGRRGNLNSAELAIIPIRSLQDTP